MKTTLVIKDDVLLRAKARAALAGKPLSRFVEESLLRALEEPEPDTRSWSEWAQSLPPVPKKAVTDLRKVLESSDFREIDPGMWT